MLFRSHKVKDVNEEGHKNDEIWDRDTDQSQADEALPVTLFDSLQSVLYCVSVLLLIFGETVENTT